MPLALLYLTDSMDLKSNSKILKTSTDNYTTLTQNWKPLTASMKKRPGSIKRSQCSVAGSSYCVFPFVFIYDDWWFYSCSAEKRKRDDKPIESQPPVDSQKSKPTPGSPTRWRRKWPMLTEISAMAYWVRKRAGLADLSVWGIATDSWWFLHIRPDGKVWNYNCLRILC